MTCCGLLLQMAADLEPEPHLLFHRDTGAILYTTVATKEEIAEANRRLAAHGERLRYVPARLVGH